MYNDRKNWYNKTRHQRVEQRTPIGKLNDADPKYDIRDWSPDDEKMGKGITLTEEEARNLLGLLEKHFG